MERAFKIKKESGIYKDYQEYLKMINFQKQCVFKFMEDHDIEAEQYYLYGEGLCDIPFEESNKQKIKLGIIPTENDKIKLGRILSKPYHDLYMLRKNSKLNKEFQDYAIEKQFVINIIKPKIGNYFESMYTYSSSIVVDKKENWYVKIESDFLGDEIPQGLEEIKMSEFYKIKENKE